MPQGRAQQGAGRRGEHKGLLDVRADVLGSVDVDRTEGIGHDYAPGSWNTVSLLLPGFERAADTEGVADSLLPPALFEQV